MKKFWLVFVVIFVFCGEVQSGVFRHDVPLEKHQELAKQSQFDCVGQLKRGNSGAGSAVMIASNWAVTSAHIFDASLEKGMMRWFNFSRGKTLGKMRG